MFEELAKHITTEEGKAALQVAQEKFNTVKTELESKDKKLVDAIATRGKYKDFTKTVKSKLGFEEGEELSEEILSSKIDGLTKKITSKSSEVEDIYKKDIENLQNQLKENQKTFEEQLAARDSDIFNIKFQNRSAQAMKGMKLVNERAYDMIHGELSANAKFDAELNDFVYRNADGTVKRNSDGTAMTVEQRAEEIRTSDDFSFLFAAPENSGSGTQQAQDTSGMTEFEKVMASM